MEFLSWLFFCLSPFALFCSEDGNGLILCPVFIILGFVLKYAGSRSTPTAVVKVEPQEFWEWHYKNRIRSAIDNKDSIGDRMVAAKDREAREWASAMCCYHNAWIPPKEEQERIARENGAVTNKMLEERAEKWNNRFQRELSSEEKEQRKKWVEEYMDNCRFL